MYYYQYIGPLVLCYLEEKREDMCSFDVHNNGSSLSRGNIGFKWGYLSLVSMKGVYIGALVGTGIGNMIICSAV
jgi:hypothetical protein